MQGTAETVAAVATVGIFLEGPQETTVETIVEIFSATEMATKPIIQATTRDIAQEVTQGEGYLTAAQMEVPTPLLQTAITMEAVIIKEVKVTASGIETTPKGVKATFLTKEIATV